MLLPDHLKTLVLLCWKCQSMGLNTQSLTYLTHICLTLSLTSCFLNQGPSTVGVCLSSADSTWICIEHRNASHAPSTAPFTFQLFLLLLQWSTVFLRHLMGSALLSYE